MRLHLSTIDFYFKKIVQHKYTVSSLREHKLRPQDAAQNRPQAHQPSRDGLEKGAIWSVLEVPCTWCKEREYWPAMCCRTASASTGFLLVTKLARGGVHGGSKTWFNIYRSLQLAPQPWEPRNPSKIRRGQKYPLSLLFNPLSLLFNVVLETVANVIRQEKIKGALTGKKKVNLSLFPDSRLVCVENLSQGVHLDFISSYKMVSWYKVKR